MMITFHRLLICNICWFLILSTSIVFAQNDTVKQVSSGKIQAGIFSSLKEAKTTNKRLRNCSKVRKKFVCSSIKLLENDPEELFKFINQKRHTRNIKAFFSGKLKVVLREKRLRKSKRRRKTRTQRRRNKTRNSEKFCLPVKQLSVCSSSPLTKSEANYFYQSLSETYPFPEVTGFVLVNAGDGSFRRSLRDGAIIDEGLFQRAEVSIKIDAANTESVHIQFDDISRTESYEPYSLLGDKGTSYTAWKGHAGSFTLTATPFSQKRKAGISGNPITITLNVKPKKRDVVGLFLTGEIDAAVYRNSVVALNENSNFDSCREIKNIFVCSSTALTMEEAEDLFTYFLESTKVSLPVKVFGTGMKTQKVPFILGRNVESEGSLSFTCHRCVFRDSSTNPERAKVSVRIDYQDWIPVTEQTVQIEGPEQFYGGIHSNSYTLRISVALKKALKAGPHTVSFRFNETDGISSGFRVIDFNIRNSKGITTLFNKMFEREDPSTWKAPFEDSNDIAAGKRLWSTRSLLRESPLNETIIKASCADCHTTSGSDLKYFNFSNESIVRRANFHGLNNFQGLRIASYIRSLPSYQSKHGRPWNPPFQPGVGIDSRNFQEWSAGAGLNAQLDHDSQMLEHLFPLGTSSEELEKIASPRETLNIRELPIPIQMPDWNAWLPNIHPLDILEETTTTQLEPAFQELYSTVANSKQAVIEDKTLPQLFETFEKKVRRHVVTGGPQPCVNLIKGKRSSPQDEGFLQAAENGYDCESLRKNFFQWVSVKVWETNNENKLEEAAAQVYRYGEKRGWVGMIRSVFDVAPHRSANNSSFYSWQSQGAGALHTMAWYHLQLVVTGGGYREARQFTPQDWFYTPAWIDAAHNENGYAPLGAFLLASKIKQYQVKDSTGTDGLGPDRGMATNGYWLNFMHPFRLERVHNSIHRPGPYWQLDEYDEGLRTRATESLLKNFLNKVEQYNAQDLPYYSSTVKATPYTGGYHLYPRADAIAQEESHAINMYRVIPRLEKLGISKQTINRLKAWSAKMWPNNDWYNIDPGKQE